MFYKFVCVCLLATCVQSAPAPPKDATPPEKQQPTVIPIVSQSDELEPNGTYKYSYETANGIKREETSYDKVVPKSRSASSNEGGESDSNESDEIHVQQGSYSYTAPDGTLISVRYIADENGFRPVGDHIPRVPSPSSDSSSEKTGRALKHGDSASSGSAPAVVAKETESQPPAGKQAESSALDSPDAPKSPSDSATTPNSGKQAQTEETPSETSSTEASDTNNAAETSSTAAPEGPSTTNSESSTSLAPEASTADVTPSEATDAPSSPATDASSTESSTESASTTTLASTARSEESSSPAESTPADSSTTEAAISTAAN